VLDSAGMGRNGRARRITGAHPSHKLLRSIRRREGWRLEAQGDARACRTTGLSVPGGQLRKQRFKPAGGPSLQPDVHLEKAFAHGCCCHLECPSFHLAVASYESTTELKTWGRQQSCPPTPTPTHPHTPARGPASAS